jgi:dinuclear metal center YbgI/SA1388 family protein
MAGDARRGFSRREAWLQQGPRLFAPDAVVHTPQGLARSEVSGSMATCVGDVLRALEQLAPSRLAEEWDNVGLQVGREDWPVGRVLVALDVSPVVIEEALGQQAQMLVTHHPLIFRPLHALDLGSPSGRMLDTLVQKRLAVAAAHTNLDSVCGGVNDLLARGVGLVAATVLQPDAVDGSSGFGRVGCLSAPTTLAALAARIKTLLGLEAVRLAGRPDLPVRRVAVCSGSGGGLLPAFWQSTAEAFVSGDLRYHDAREAELRDRGLIDIGHYESEALVLEALAQDLAARLARTGDAVEVRVSRVEMPPFTIV